MPDRLEEYRRKRDARRTPEPVPAGPPRAGGDQAAIFVIQQHHARRLHWDLRLERNGTLVSWAVPRGLPRDPNRNHLAVHTEDHPMEYATFSGEIPQGEYGGGRMTIYDRGSYVTEKWRDDEVIVVLSGDRVAGRYVLFRTSGKDWMIHRMDPPPPGWTPMPERVAPMRPAPAAKLPPDDDAWAYELLWPGARASAEVSGGRLRLVTVDTESGEETDLTPAFGELREMAEELAPTECLLDGVLVAFDAAGRVSEEALGPRLAAADRPPGRPRANRATRSSRTPAQYLIFDLLWLDGTPTLELPYRQRRELLEELGIAGGSWQTPPYFPGGGAQALDTARAQELPGVVAKRLDSPYLPGSRGRKWLRIRSHGSTADRGRRGG
jgi:bifunctional non-homologous end joining protein LigD